MSKIGSSEPIGQSGDEDVPRSFGSHDTHLAAQPDPPAEGIKLTSRDGVPSEALVKMQAAVFAELKEYFRRNKK